jgi:hypothetical protein
MMQARSPTDVETNRDPVRQKPLEVERLEFGKFCVSPDGPIQSNVDNIPIEYSQLGWSSGFPAELISICYPTSIGIVREEGEALPRENAHGTVLRPIVPGSGKKIRPILYRVRSRAEEGEGQSGRRYTLARYLAASSHDVDPLMMLEAMDSAPLRGITRSEASVISAIDVKAADPQPAAAGDAFLREALIFILSGIPLSITEDISEPEFFALAAALRSRLPPALHPHLSAGWNVGSSYSGRLGITYTTHRAATAALFSPTALTWSPPEYVTTWDAQMKPVSNRFFESRLEPGRLYDEYVFAEGGRRSLTDLSPAFERLSSLVGSLPPVELPELPDWHDRKTVRIFRYAGLKAKDEFAIAALERWLATGEDEDNPRRCLDARKLNYQSNRLRALNLILRAMADPATRPRADQALWLSVLGKSPSSFTNSINGTTGAGAPRARLMAALGCDDVSESLRALTLASGSEGEDFPETVAVHLDTILDRSLTQVDKTPLPYHERLVQSPPTRYRQWVARRPLELMRALASQLGFADEAKVYAAIIEINPSDKVRALYELIKGERPPPALGDFLTKLQPADLNIFIDLFNQEWSRRDEKTAARRETLLAWFDALKPKENSDPLLRLRSGEDLVNSEVLSVADDVEPGYVPTSLLPGVAALALDRWVVVGRRIMDQPRRWGTIANLWPNLHARALIGAAGTNLPRPEVERAARDMRIPFADLNTLLHERAIPISFPSVAPLFWDWALHLESRPGQLISALDLCTYLKDGQLPNRKLATRSELDLFIRLARESRRLSLPSEAVQQMWFNAAQPWHLTLLLSLFPQEDFNPSGIHLAWLIQSREWLINHLRSPQVHKFRRNRFYVATQPFHSLSYLKDERLWLNSFVKSSVWAAFSRVPVKALPKLALRRALRGYSGADWDDWEQPTARQKPELIERQATLCLVFLRNYLESASLRGALTMVLSEFVIPLLSDRYREAEIYEVMDDVEAAFPRSGSTRRREYSFPPEFANLLTEIVMLSDLRFIEKAIRQYYKERR